VSQQLQSRLVGMHRFAQHGKYWPINLRWATLPYQYILSIFDSYMSHVSRLTNDRVHCIPHLRPGA